MQIAPPFADLDFSLYFQGNSNIFGHFLMPASPATSWTSVESQIRSAAWLILKVSQSKNFKLIFARISSLGYVQSNFRQTMRQTHELKAGVTAAIPSSCTNSAFSELLIILSTLPSSCLMRNYTPRIYCYRRSTNIAFHDCFASSPLCEQRC